MTATSGPLDESGHREVRQKVCLVGDERVGKTSLVRRFVTGRFDEAYLRTLGALVTRKSITLEESGGRRATFHMLIWDIMGTREFEQLFRDAYFSRAAGVIAVFDLTRPNTLASLTYWLDGVRSAVGEKPVVVLANKADLKDQVAVDDPEIRAVLGSLKHPVFRTSARTGENVEQAFVMLAREILRAK